MIHKIYTPPDFSSTKFTVVLFSENRAQTYFTEYRVKLREVVLLVVLTLSSPNLARERLAWPNLSRSMIELVRDSITDSL